MKPSGTKKRIFNVFLLGSIMVIGTIFIGQTLYDSGAPVKTALQRIRERGYIVAGTDRNSLNYFIYRGEPMGYQYELLTEFAHSVNLPLRIIASNDISNLYRLMDNHAIDILALNLPATRENRKKFAFTKPFGDTRLILVQRRKGAVVNGDTTRFISSLKDFRGDTVVVPSNPYMSAYYKKFTYETDEAAVLWQVNGVNEAELVRKVAEGTLKYCLCPENLAMAMKRSFPGIDVSVVVIKLYPFAWGLNYYTDSLKVMLNGWIDSARSEKVLSRINTAYYNNQRSVNFFRNPYSSIVSERLSPFDKEIRKLSRMIWWDWRLVGSLVYEESNFSLGKVSHRSASGLMQLIPQTAERYGLDSTSGPAHQIAAGIRYLQWIDSQLPEEISDPRERINFCLAAYNIGIGKVLASRNKARKFGKDPNRWNGNVEYYLLKRSKKDPYAAADTALDIPIDYNPEGYVDRIVSRYYHYRNLIPQ